VVPYGHAMFRRGAALVTGAVLAVSLLAACARAAPPATLVPTTTQPASTTVPTPSVVATRQPHLLVFTATGDAGVDSVTYIVDGHTVTDRSVHLPWRVTLDLPADGALHNYSVTIRTRSGDVRILAILDGKVQSQSDGGGTGTGTAQLSGDLAG
jgi:hypothetical protein